MSACKQWVDRLLEASLGAGASAELAAHLSDCPGCSAEAERLRRQGLELDAALAVLVNAEPPRDFRRNVLAGVQAGIQSARFRPLWVRVLAAAAVGVLFAAVVVRLNRPDPELEFAAAAYAWRAPTDTLLDVSGSRLLQSELRVGEFYFALDSPALTGAGAKGEGSHEE